MGLCAVEVVPSPKLHRYETVPLQLDGVAEPVNWIGDPRTPPAGAVALHDTMQPPGPVIVMLPDCMQVTPLAEAVSVHVKVPVEPYVCVGFWTVAAGLPSPKFQT